MFNATDTTEPTMTITCTLTTDPCRFVRFTWSDDLSTCDFVAVGVDDDAVDALIAADGHEGATVDGWATTVA